jgi:hypothetical protein
MNHFYTRLYFKPALAAAVLPLLFLMFSCQKEVSDFSVTTLTKQVVVDTPIAGIKIMNNTPGPIRLTINGVTNDVLLNTLQTDTVFGRPLDTANVLVETVVTDGKGNPVGRQLVYQYALPFPTNKTFGTKSIDIPANIFFVGIINDGPGLATQLMVSGIGNNASSTSYSFPIVNNHNLVAGGYYPAYKTGVNIQVGNCAMGDPKEWHFSSIQFADTLNQKVILNCN